MAGTALGTLHALSLHPGARGTLLAGDGLGELQGLARHLGTPVGWH